MVKAGKITDFRLRKNGSLVSFNFQGRRIRLSTLANFLCLLTGQTGAAGAAQGNTGAAEYLADFIKELSGSRK